LLYGNCNAHQNAILTRKMVDILDNRNDNIKTINNNNNNIKKKAIEILVN